jgi:hypothetical protein
MINVMQKNDESRPEMDDLLHDYFQTEMPRPWPTFKAPRQKPTLSLWSRSASRMALAACVALLIGGYLTLGGSFTAPETSDLHQVAPPNAFNPKGPKAKPATPLPQDEILPAPTPMGTQTTKQKSQ